MKTSEIGMRVTALAADCRTDALGLGNPAPALSWRVDGTTDDWIQKSYRLRCEIAGRSIDSGEIVSRESAFVEWPFEPLQSRQQVWICVRVSGEDGSESSWSEPLVIEGGLLSPEDWSAGFITPDWDEDRSVSQPSPLLRREFEVGDGLRSARLYITACGCYEAVINGQRVGDDVMAPGWTSYKHRLRVQTHDVIAMLHQGPNAIGAMLGDGWYSGRLGFGTGKRNQWGDRLALLAQLELRYADGRTERVTTNDGWRASTGGLVSSEIYDGETFDARLEPAGWQVAGFDDSHWAGVRRHERPLDTLVAPEGPPMRRIDTVAPVNILKSPSGKTILDFGQNLVGWVRIRVSGARGRRLTFRFVEVLQDGEICTLPLRTAKSTDQYILSGQGTECWEPRFTFHGFRYVEVSGWPGEPSGTDIEAVIIHSDMERTGWFECSDPLVSRLHENVVWSMRGNFLDVPTDCPQRDERMGWTGDIQVFTPTAAYLYDCHGMLGSWLRCLASEQQATGVVPYVVPDCMGGVSSPPTAAWGDVAVMTPWVLFERSGNRPALARQYPSMKAWVDQVAQIAGDSGLWNKGFQFGDWLDPYAPADKPAAGKTHPYLLATAHLARSSHCLAKAAKVLGRDEEAQRYSALSDRVRQAFLNQYVTPDGLMLGDSVTAYAMALVFDLVQGVQRDGAARRLKELVSESAYRIATGFVGTPLVCDALLLAGAPEMAYKLLLQKKSPSWLYPVTQGATTIWERWDGLLPDGRINTSGMTSFNHYAFGAVADWLHRAVGGLSALEPGYRRLRIAPLPGGELTEASTSHRTPYGLATVHWQVEGGKLHVEAAVPPNTRAEVHLPGQESFEVGSGAHSWSVAFTPSRAGARKRLTVQSTVAELMQDDEAWAAVRAAMIRAMPELAEFIDHDTGGQQHGGNTPLIEQLSLIPGNTVTNAVAEALDALFEARERGEALAADEPTGATESPQPLTGHAATVAKLTLEEKASLVCGATAGTTQSIERLGIPSLRVSDGPHGLRCQPVGGDHLGIYDSEPATCFPTAAALASSWNTSLIERVGRALAAEAHAMGVQILLGPGINIKRSPLCGRNFEYFSEDPMVSGAMGGAWVRGVQGEGIGASLKHYAANNQETDRMRVDAQVDERTLREIYLPAFEQIVREEQPWTVMAAYNKVNGLHACENPWLLTRVLRQEWGFAGLVVSDWGAVTDLPACLQAGTDLDMPSRGPVGPETVVQAVKTGQLKTAALDRAVTKLLELTERAASGARVQGRVDFDKHHELARQAAVESAVLLKNDDALLPLDANAPLRIAVIGEFARTPRYQGEGSSKVRATRVDDALSALRKTAGSLSKIEFAAGFAFSEDERSAGLRDEAVALAERSDVILLFLGLPDKEESEGFDRSHIQLPVVQRELLAALAKVQPNLVVLLSNGGVVQTSDWEDMARAILELWLGGQAGGGAVADLVFGLANPSGRLAETIPVRLEDTTAYLNFPGHGGVVRYGEGLYVGYRGYDKRRQDVSYPFGHGMSYTRFEYSDLRASVLGEGQQSSIEVQAKVRNVGEHAGQEVVQLYVGDPEAAIDRPLRELKGFEKVFLHPGETKEVTFIVTPRDLSYYSVDLNRWVLEGGIFEVALGASSRDLRLVQSVQIRADLPAAAISGDSRILEWLAHPKGGPVLRNLLSQSPQQGDMDATLRLIEGMPMNRLVALSQGALTQDMVDQMVAAANA